MKPRILNILALAAIALSLMFSVVWLSDISLAIQLVPTAEMPPGVTWDTPVDRYFGLLRYDIAGNTAMGVLNLTPRFFLILGLALAVFPARHGYLWCKRKLRVAKGLCLVCGYDLRGTPSRCPECGTEPIPSNLPQT